MWSSVRSFQAKTRLCVCVYVRVCEYKCVCVSVSGYVTFVVDALERTRH